MENMKKKKIVLPTLAADRRRWWEKQYRLQHDWDIDLSHTSIPPDPEDGKGWILLCIAKGLTPNQEFNSWTFPKWKVQDDLDALAYKNVRNTKESYFIWVRNDAEPGAEFFGKSTNEADPDMKIGMTLLERLVFQSYANRIGLVLDKERATLCSGSRNSNGVPCVHLNHGGKVDVSWYSSDDRNNVHCVRRAVAK